MISELTGLIRAGLMAGCLLLQAGFAGVAEAAPPLPDFIVESIVVGPETIVQGRPLAVTAVVRNQGNAAGDARYLDVWYRWTNGVPPVFGDVGDAWAPVGRLGPGESRTVVVPPQYLAYSGTNRLCARVEFENLVSESVNTNNHLCIAYVAAPVATLLAPVHRFWSNRYRGHFFTVSEAEKNTIVATLSQDWRYEGIAYYAYTAAVAGTVPLYRFWSSRYRGHFFTISQAERDHIIANLSRDWRYEGVAYHVYPSAASGRSPVYRFWSNRYKHHFFTVSEAEKDNIVSNMSSDWAYEGIAYYVPSVRAASPSGTGSAMISGGANAEAAIEVVLSDNKARATRMFSVFFHRDKHQREIDLMIEDNGTRHPVEIKKGARLDAHDVRCFRLLDRPGAPVGTGALVSQYPQVSALAESALAIPASRI